MPQQPKITDDAQVDSWALQVTQELNALALGGVGGGTTVVANPGGTPPNTLTTITIDGVSYQISAAPFTVRNVNVQEGTPINVAVTPTGTAGEFDITFTFPPTINTTNSTAGVITINASTRQISLTSGDAIPADAILIINGVTFIRGSDYTIAAGVITLTMGGHMLEADDEILIFN